MLIIGQRNNTNMCNINFSKPIELAPFDPIFQLNSSFVLNKWQVKRFKHYIDQNDLLEYIKKNGALQNAGEDRKGLPQLESFFTVQDFKKYFLQTYKQSTILQKIFLLRLRLQIKYWSLRFKNFKEVGIYFYEDFNIQEKLAFNLTGSWYVSPEDNPFYPETTSGINMDEIINKDIKHLFISGENSSKMLSSKFISNYNNPAYINGYKLYYLIFNPKPNITDSFLQTLEKYLQNSDTIIIEEISVLINLHPISNLITKYIFSRSKRVIITSSRSLQYLSAIDYLKEIETFYQYNLCDHQKIKKSSEVFNKFFEAVQSNNIKETKKLLKKHEYIIDSFRDPLQGSALAVACRKGYYELVRFLLYAGANPDSPFLKEINAVGDYYVNFITPLNIAITHRHIEIAMYLIQNGADPNLQDASAKSPLFIAVVNNDIELVKLLIDAGADVNMNLKQPQPLTIAIENQNLEIISILLDAGAKILTPTPYRNGKSTIDIAYATNCPEIINLMPLKEKKGKVSIYYACFICILEVCSVTSYSYLAWRWFETTIIPSESHISPYIVISIYILGGSILCFQKYRLHPSKIDITWRSISQIILLIILLVIIFH